MTKSIILHQINSENKGTLFIRFFDGHGNKKLISLKFKMFKKDFEKSYIKDLLLFGKNQNFNHIEINNKVREYENHNPFSETQSVNFTSFTDFFKREVDNTTKQSTKHTNQYVLNSLNDFRKTIHFEDLNRDLMKSYMNFLIKRREAKPIRKSTIRKYFQVIKTVCNIAKREGHIINENTFDIVIGKDENINNKVLTKNDIEILNNIQKDQRYFYERNVFLFSLYTQGLRVSDALFIRVENFKQSHIEIGMTKTKNTLQIQYSDKIMDILMDVLDIPNPIKRFKMQNAQIYIKQQANETLIDRHTVEGRKKRRVQKEILSNLLKSKYQEFNIKETILKKFKEKYKPNDFLFKDLLNDHYFKNSMKVDIDNKVWRGSQISVQNYNQKLKIMSRIYDLSVGQNISSHSARYTFVNLLLEKNTNVYLISKALGHSNLSITEKYIRRNFGAERLNITETLSNIFD
ncbi:phage integrase family protein [Flavobacterium sp. 1]|uniref:tyrosine-type recombinase/integrase n=1 Tax=Flavobacterium sp. 1 TaxID=2035200 RepID=UPI000C239FAF|nr:site-specific integrase [Flavobacterium sp. 1]PJJ09812.1 phage integrase family protein [Flavobacterium sp. 1]